MIIREIENNDIKNVLKLMRVFYDSPAVIVKTPDDLLEKDLLDAVGDCPYLDGYVMVVEDKIIGYSLVASSYSTEYGGLCIFIEDLYVDKNYRHKGYGSKMLEYIHEKYPAVRFKLEAEEDNEKALSLYRKMGYKVSGYKLMSKLK
jgi:ribosomal protein S18 acetylase RimI-like enzyme